MVHYFYKKLTLTAKSNKNGKKTLKVQFFFSQEKSNSCGVLIAYFGTGTFTVKNEQSDKEGRIFIVDVSINDSEYIMINLYEQIDVLSSLSKLLEYFDINLTKQLVIAGDFDLFLTSKLEAQGGNPAFNRSFSGTLLSFKRKN